MSHARCRGGPFGFTCRVSTRRHVAKWKERRSRNRAPILRIPPKWVKPISPYETGRPRPTPEHYRHSGFPFRHPRLLPFRHPRLLPFRHPRLLPFRHPRLLPPLSSLPSPLPSSPPSPPSVILAFSPLCHPRLLPPLSSSTLVIEDPGFFACIPAPSHGATPQAFPPPQAFGVTVKRRVPMRVTSLASYPTKMSTR